jgi:hypothetical protein
MNYLQNINIKNTKPYLIAGMVYILAGGILLNFHQYSYDQDIISYLSISLKYFHGDFTNAVNGVWSPLISWLLLPILYFNFSLLFGFKIIQLVLGLILLLFMIRFMSLNLASNRILVTSILFIPLILYFVFLTGTPDLLNAVMLVAYLYFLYDEGKNKINVKYAVIIGLLGTFAYLSKSYSFVFFLLHFSIYSIIKGIIFKEKKILIRYSMITISIFIITSSIWIALLYVKYDQVTISTAGSYNIGLIGPKYNGVHLIRYNNLYPPVNESAVSYWEDPTFLELEKWNPLSSTADIFHLVNRINHNTKMLIFHFLPFIPMLFFFFFLIEKKAFLQRNWILLFTLGTYLCGYLILFIEQRFLIFPYFILFLINLLLLKQLFTERNLRLIKYFIVAITAVMMTAQPAYSLINNLNKDREISLIYNEIKDKIEAKSNIASLSSQPLELDWTSSLSLSYHLSAKYFGEINSEVDDQTFIMNLKDYKIEYLFLWNTSKDVLDEGKFEKIYDFTYKNDFLIKSFLNSQIDNLFLFFNKKRNVKYPVRNLQVFKVNSYEDI